MHYVALYVLSFLLFSQTLRLGQKKDADMLTVTAANYVVAAIFCVAYWSLLGFPGFHTVKREIWVAGFGNGLLYFLNLLAMLMAYRLVGVGITSASIGISLIIPVVLSWALWEEAMPVSRGLAVFLAPFAIGFMRPIQNVHAKRSMKAELSLIACFLCAGGVRTIHKYATVITGPEPEQLRLYQALVWLGAAAASTSYVMFRNVPYHFREILVGVFAGFFNAFTLFFTLLSLSVVAAVVFFPTSLCSVILLNLLISWVLWKERLVKRQIFGIVLAIAVVILVNMDHL